MAVFSCLPAIVWAQQSCLPHDQAVQRLKQLHGEEQIGLGLSKRGKAVSLFVSPGGSWTITVTHPNGLTCVKSSGQAWQRTPLLEGDET